MAELLAIRPLDREHTGLLVAACLTVGQPPDELVELAWQHSAGNSLVAEELLYELIDTGQLRRDGEDGSCRRPGLYRRRAWCSWSLTGSSGSA